MIKSIKLDDLQEVTGCSGCFQAKQVVDVGTSYESDVKEIEKSSDNEQGKEWR